MTDPVAFIHVQFEKNGDMNLEIQGQVSYVQIYGIAALLHEQARQQHAMANLQAQQKSVEVVRSMPVRKGTDA